MVIEKIENVQKHRVESDRILEDKNQLVTQQSQIDVSLVWKINNRITWLF